MAEEKRFIFRINDNGVGPEIIRHVFLERGWVEYDEDTHNDYEWNFWWKTSRFRQSEYDQLLSWQRLNHYPKTSAITRKDSLARTLKRMKCVYGAAAFNFSPIAFNLPNDYKRFIAEYEKLKDKNPDEELYWICKPADMSRGRGIFIFKDINNFKYDCNAVVQKYIPDPLLVSGYKFDLRVYVSVPSFQPLHIYIYQEGLCRFGTEKYDLSMLHNPYSHLTNTSINKHSPSFSAEKERVGPGCKWTLTQLRYYFRQCHIDDQIIWQRIINIIILTLVTQASEVPKVNNCFELYGFDILLDKNLKPWLLEVNFSPALSTDMPVDLVVKRPMLHDLIEMCNFKQLDVKCGGEKFKQHQLHKVYAGPKASSRWASLSDKGQRSNRSNKLPDISLRANVNPSPGLLRGKTSSSLGSHGDSTWDEGEEDRSEGEEGPMPLIPGCGLPSVQQLQDPPERRCSTSSSGQSSTKSSNRQFKKSANSTRSRVQSLDSIPEPRQEPGCHRESSRTSLVSADSAISSESSDPVPINDDMRARRRCRVDSSTRLCSRLSTPKTPSAQMTSRQNSFAIQGDSSSGKQFHVDYRDTKSLAAKKKSPRSFSQSRLYDIHQQKRKESMMGYTENPVIKRSMLSNRYELPGSDMNNNRPILAQANQKQPGPPHSVGDFFLVYPFNESPRKPAGNIDIKSIARECHKRLKTVQQKQCAADSRSTQRHKDAQDNPQGKHNGVSNNGLPTLWGPVRLPDGEDAC